MSSWTVASDSHFKASEPLGRINPETRVNLRTEAKLESLDSFFKRSEELEVDFVVYAGDLFDTANPPSRLRAKVSEVFRKYSDRLPIFYLSGNHDDSGEVGAMESEGFLTSSFGKDTEVAVHKLNPGFYYIKDPLEINHVGLALNLLFVPYRYRGKLNTFFPPWRQGKREFPLVLFSHFFAQGANISKTNLPLKLKGNGLSSKLMKRFDLVQLGDIHIPQNMGHVYYPGCLSRINIDDGEIEPGFLHTTYSAGKEFEMEFCPVEDWGIKRYVVEEGAGQDIDDVYCLNFEKIQVLELTFKGSRTWLSEIPCQKMRKKLMDKGVITVHIFRNPVDAEYKEVSPETISDQTTLLDKWTAYAEESELPEEVIKCVVEELSECTL